MLVKNDGKRVCSEGFGGWVWWNVGGYGEMLLDGCGEMLVGEIGTNK